MQCPVCAGLLLLYPGLGLLVCQMCGREFGIQPEIQQVDVITIPKP